MTEADLATDAIRDGLDSLDVLDIFTRRFVEAVAAGHVQTAEDEVSGAFWLVERHRGLAERETGVPWPEPIGSAG